VVVKGKEILCPKCRTCHIYRPPRSFHCRECRACIEVHDHHCPWVGTCVGKRNHRYFLAFAIATCLHATLTCSLNVIYMYDEMYPEPENSEWPVDKLISLLILVYTACIICCTSGLSCYHGKLACCGETTNEEIRGKYIGGNPYD
jgi:palmitoyltransferase ZDHHC9/14/18